jgi:nucleotide-binding universal stress UspA family protein
VLVGVAADRPDSAAMEFAAGLASAQGCALDVVHAWHSGDAVVDRPGDQPGPDSMDRHERALAEAISGLAEKFPDVQVNRHMPEQKPVDALVERSAAADCVVLGSRGRVGARGLLGSVSRAVIEHAHSTVVVVRG